MLQARLVIGAVTVFLLFRVSIVLFSCMGDLSSVVDLLFDDAYYYLAVAYNFANHHFSSFDRITETNGYQPLWFLLLSCFEGLTGFDKREFFSLVLALVGVVSAAPLLYCLYQRDRFSLALAAGLLASYACYPFVWTLGLETLLFAPLFVAIVYSVKNRGFVESWGRVSFWFIPVLLVRIDALSLLLGYAAPLFFATARIYGYGLALKRVVLFMLPSCVVLALYFLMNFFLFGSPFPVSGVAKMAGAEPFSNWGIIFYYLLNMQYLLVPLVLLMLGEFLYGKFRDGSFFYYGMLVLLICGVVQYFYYAIFSGWMPWPWYFYHYAMILVLVIARAFCIGKGVAAATVVVFVLVFPIAMQGSQIATSIYLYIHPQKSGFTFNQRSMDDLSDSLASGANVRILMGDRAGGLGYWAPENIQVFQLEGLVSDFEYLRARKRGEGVEWISQKIRPDFLLVDREYLPLVEDENGVPHFVVVEPIQGRVVFDGLLSFCFPEDAVVSFRAYTSPYPSLLVPNAVRYLFDMNKNQPCDGRLDEYVQEWISSKQGVRRYSLPVEYDNYPLNAWLEGLDRSRSSSSAGRNR
jgi:hypothetical protein